MTPRARAIVFLGNSLDDLRNWPVTARREAGHQLDQLQAGRMPDDWKPMTTIGAGLCEIRVFDETGAFRVIYALKFEAAIYVLHCFRKTSQKTSRHDLDLASRRFRSLLSGEAR